MYIIYFFNGETIRSPISGYTYSNGMFKFICGNITITCKPEMTHARIKVGEKENKKIKVLEYSI